MTELEPSVEELYEHAPCGYLSTLPDGTIVRANETFLRWTGHAREALVGIRRFHELLTVGGRIYHETHYAPLLRMQGSVREIALEIVCADGRRLPVLVNSTRVDDEDGQPALIRTTVFDATERRAYERELLRARDRERHVSHVLQQSLLAGDPPRDPRVAIATHYRPADDSLAVGGDWHDAFPIGADRIGVVVGDVVGRGIEAASAMGQVRSATRALALACAGPGEVIDRLDAFVAHVPAAFLATLVYAEVGLEDGAVRFASAGHPPPVVMAPGEAPSLLWEGRSFPLGLPDGTPRRQASATLAPGARLLLYTDGLVERHDRPVDEGLARLAEELTARRETPLPALVEQLTDALLSGDRRRDDVCVLCVGRRPT